MDHLVGHFFDGSRLNHLASLCAMAKETGRLVCLEPGAHDIAEGAMRGQRSAEGRPYDTSLQADGWEDAQTL